jgi:4-hydroxybenzoate polyprenyltransferase
MESQFILACIVLCCLCVAWVLVTAVVYGIHDYHDRRIRKINADRRRADQEQIT